MIEWTEDAKKAFQRYVSLIKGSVESMEADPQEVEEDLRRHIEEELGKGNSTIITGEDVRQVVQRMGLLDVALTVDVPGGDLGGEMTPPKVCRWRWWETTLVVGFGVALPALALLVEYGEHLSGNFYVNPIPTMWHILLILLVPLANLAVWGMAEVSVTGIRLKALGWLNGIAIGIALFYVVVFIPMVPFGVVAIIGMGIGFLPLAPLLSLIAAIVLRVKVSSSLRESVGYRLPGLFGGCLLGLLILAGIVLPVTITRVGLKMAISKQPETRMRGLSLLERFGDEGVLIQSCYRRPQPMGMMDPIGGLLTGMHPVDTWQTREIVYRVTGKPFNTFPLPYMQDSREFLRDFEPVPDEDEFFTGYSSRCLSLTSSRMDGSVAPDAALGYLEWTLEFKNDTKWQQEARGQIDLPPGGVVSRLTLWVNGEEREAAFGSRASTSQAYERVVRKKRDPVLVTTSGKDRATFQCFPVLPGGGTMKIRLGITFPLILVDKETAFLRLPYFSERNFKIGKTFQHSVWVESKQPFKNSSKAFLAENPKPELFAVRGNLSNADLFSATGVVCSVRHPEVVSVWAPDVITKDGSRIQQSISPGFTTPPARVVVVVDGSLSMKPWIGPVMESFSAFPSGIELMLIHSGWDGMEVIEPDAVTGDQARTLISTKLPSFSYKGGCDNIEALKQAWDLAAAKPGSVILWIHGPQPVIFGGVHTLTQRWQRRPDGPKLLSLQVSPGRNWILEDLGVVSQVEPVMRLGTLNESLQRLFNQWSGKQELLQIHREKIASGTSEEITLGEETSLHLVRLWAKDQIESLRTSATPESASREVALASVYKLVTPLMGAVVLETEQQYKVAGLEVPDAQGIPTIPEPQTWMLILVVMLLLAWAVVQQRKHGCLRG